MRLTSALLLSLVTAACAKSSHGAAATAASASAEAQNPASASDGAVVYLANCSTCHQADGQGVRGAFPPLARNPVVTGDPTAAIIIVKDGLDGRVFVNGQPYAGIMPRWRGVLSDEQIAAALTYIRSAWHNRASGISAAQVHAVR